ncbi:MAG: hypothetical protein RBU30_07575 [Polyangia bacterium]|nr:hypothetical protein [Polyangia bacterium]
MSIKDVTRGNGVPSIGNICISSGIVFTAARDNGGKKDEQPERSQTAW